MRIIYCLAFLMMISQVARTQTSETKPNAMTLEQCIAYGMEHQPVLKQAQLSEEVAKKDISIRLSDWLPQVSANANVQNNLKRQTNVLQVGDQPPQTLTFGAKYTSTVGVSVEQVIFNNDVLLAKQTASEYQKQAAQNVADAKIDLVVNISKAYYQVLTTQQQLAVLDQTIERLNKNLTDAKNRYNTGVADKIDYKRAQISLNNALAQRKGTKEALKGQVALLKQLMGYGDEKPLLIADHVDQMEEEALLDTTSMPNYSDRIEYQLLQTQQSLSKASISYYKNDFFIPSLSAFYNYNWAYLNDDFSTLYNKNYPNSVVGLRLSLPIFQGMRRIKNVQKSKLQYEQLELQEENLERQINTEYVQALGTYKSNLEQLQASRENYEIADDVYKTVKLQYDEGIKAYLELIVAESDLRTSQLNYLSALLHVLSSKLDVQKAAGTINIISNSN